MYLSHLRLAKTKENAEVYSRMLDNRYVEHQELWKMFAPRSPGEERPFLHRCDLTESGFEVHMLSNEQPTNMGAWGARTREYAPALKSGQRLSFQLRVAPLVDRAQTDKTKPSKRTDMVMEAFAAKNGSVPVKEVANSVAEEWLGSRGPANGLKLSRCEATNYQAVMVRKGRSPAIRLPLLDIAGELEVTDPEAFMARHLQGWGRARYAGCGLMLLRRAVY